MVWTPSPKIHCPQRPGLRRVQSDVFYTSMIGFERVLPCHSIANARSTCRSRNRVNGAAQTFRRTSATTPSQTQQRESAVTSNTGNEGVYIPPHLNSSNSSRNLPLGDTRYGKEQMLSIYQTLRETSALDRHLDEIFLGGWEPLDSNNGAPSQGGRGDGKDAVPGPEVCWNHNSDLAPLGLMSMSEEEKQVRNTSVSCNIKHR